MRGFIYRSKKEMASLLLTCKCLSITSCGNCSCVIIRAVWVFERGDGRYCVLSRKSNRKRTPGVRKG